MSPTAEQSRNAASGRVARRRRRMRDALAAAALGAFRQRGVDAVSVEELLAAADVSRATFYQLFPSKYKVLEYILNPVFKDLIRGVEALRARPAEHVVDGLAALWLDAHAAHGDAVLLLGRLETAELGDLEASAAKLREALLDALGRVENADLLRNGSARYSMKLVTETAIPLLRVYAGHPGAEALFRDALGGLLLQAH